MDEDGFEWDEEKRLTNIAKHGIDFRDIPLAFGFPYIEDYDF
ncbi:MAG: BrnT family toxin [Rhodospirillales bacterium]